MQLSERALLPMPAALGSISSQGKKILKKESAAKCKKSKTKTKNLCGFLKKKIIPCFFGAYFFKGMNYNYEKSIIHCHVNNGEAKKQQLENIETNKD